MSLTFSSTLLLPPYSSWPFLAVCYASPPDQLSFNILLSGLPRWFSGQESVCQCRRPRRCGFSPWFVKIPWRRNWQPTPVFLPGKSHEQRSLMGYHPWGQKELDMTQRRSTHTHLSLWSSLSPLPIPVLSHLFFHHIKSLGPFFFFKIFFMWTIFKVFIEFVTILLLFYFVNFWPQAMWD